MHRTFVGSGLEAQRLDPPTLLDVLLQALRNFGKNMLAVYAGYLQSIHKVFHMKLRSEGPRTWTSLRCSAAHPYLGWHSQPTSALLRWLQIASLWFRVWVALFIYSFRVWLEPACS